MQTALCEVREETAIEGNRDGRRPTDWHAENVYPPDPRWGGVLRRKSRITPSTSFGLLVPEHTPVRLNQREHTQLIELPWQIAAGRCSSAANAKACLTLPKLRAFES